MILVLFLLAAGAPVLPLQHSDQTPRATHCPQGGVVVPMLDWGGRPVAEIRLGDGEPLKVIVDTGSTLGLFLAPAACEANDLAGGGTADVHLGDARFEALPVTPSDFPLGPVEGVLGLPCFAGGLLTFDFAAREIGFAPGELAPADGVFSFREDGRLGFGVTVDLDVAGVTVPAHVDTGAPNLATFSMEVIDEVPLTGEPRLVGHARTPMGDADIHGATLEGTLRLGPIEVVDPELRFAALPQIAGRVMGNVGAEFFRGTSLTLDVKNGRARIQPGGRRAASSGPPRTLADALARFDGEYRIEGQVRAGRGPDAPLQALDGRATWETAADGRRRHERFELDGPTGPLRGEAWLGAVNGGPGRAGAGRRLQPARVARDRRPRRVRGHADARDVPGARGRRRTAPEVGLPLRGRRRPREGDAPPRSLRCVHAGVVVPLRAGGLSVDSRPPRRIARIRARLRIRPDGSMRSKAQTGRHGLTAWRRAREEMLTEPSIARARALVERSGGPRNWRAGRASAWGAPPAYGRSRRAEGLVPGTGPHRRPLLGDRRRPRPGLPALGARFPCPRTKCCRWPGAPHGRDWRQKARPRDVERGG